MESLANEVAPMERDQLIRAILTIRCNFPVDLTEEYLRALSLERLRHIYVALSQHAKAASPGETPRHPSAG